MTRTIDLRHGRRGGTSYPDVETGLFPRLRECADDNFHWSQDPLPVAASTHQSAVRCFGPSWKGPEEVLHRRGLPRPWAKGVIPQQDTLNQSPPVGRVPEAAAVTQRSPWVRFDSRRLARLTSITRRIFRVGQRAARPLPERRPANRRAIAFVWSKVAFPGPNLLTSRLRKCRCGVQSSHMVAWS
jgi:hypothetical protein